MGGGGGSGFWWGITIWGLSKVATQQSENAGHQQAHGIWPVAGVQGNGIT